MATNKESKLIKALKAADERHLEIGLENKEIFMRLAEEYIDTKLEKLFEFSHEFWFNKPTDHAYREPQCQSLVVMNTAQDDWLSNLICQHVGQVPYYVHKDRLLGSILANWYEFKNKKDIKYNLNSINHLWISGLPTNELKDKIADIKGKTLYATWDFDYLIDQLLNKKKHRYEINLKIHKTKRDAELYKKYWTDSSGDGFQYIKKEQDIERAFAKIQGRRYKSPLFNITFDDLKKIQIPADIDVISMPTIVDHSRDYFGPKMKQIFMNKFEDRLINYYGIKGLAVYDEEEFSEIFKFDLTDCFKSINRTKKKMVQTNIESFKELLQKEVA